MQEDHPRKAIILRAVLFFSLPLLIFGWTSIDLLANLTLGLAMIVLLITITAMMLTRGKVTTRITLLRSSLIVTLVLLLTGATNWFFSPFFFLLYLVPIYLGFVWRPIVAFSFLAAVLLIFSGSVGEVDLAYDFMILLSLIAVVPLVIFLRKRFLIIRQTHKDILILEDRTGIQDFDTITKLLANKVTNLGVTMRQPLTYIKQSATLLLQERLDGKEVAKLVGRIRTTAAEALEQVRSFEGKTSANEVLRNVKKERK